MTGKNNKPRRPDIPTCPLGEDRKCFGYTCALWDDDWCGCSLHSRSIENHVRIAIADAAVEIVKAYGKEREA